MPEWLANPPWYIPAGLGLLALILLHQGNNLQNKKVKFAGLGLATLAAIVLVLGMTLESNHERVARNTRELAAAVDKRDWKAFRALLDPKVKFDLFEAFNGADQLTAGAQKTADNVNVKDITISGIEIKDEPGGHVVDFMATAEVDIGGRRPTNWRFYWGKNDDGSFSLYRITPLPNPMLGTDPIIGRFVKP